MTESGLEPEVSLETVSRHVTMEHHLNGNGPPCHRGTEHASEAKRYAADANG